MPDIGGINKLVILQSFCILSLNLHGQVLSSIVKVISPPFASTVSSMEVRPEKSL